MHPRKPTRTRGSDSDWCALLVTRDSGRIFRGGPTGIREPATCTPTRNQHQAGGWSQARFERSVDQEVEWHLEKVTSG